MPDAVDVPLIVIMLLAKLADTPAGKPLAPDIPLLLIPVAPVVICVMLVSGVLIQSVGEEDAAPAVLFAVTVMVPVAFTLPQPPVSGIL